MQWLYFMRRLPAQRNRGSSFFFCSLSLASCVATFVCGTASEDGCFNRRRVEVHSRRLQASLRISRTDLGRRRPTAAYTIPYSRGQQKIELWPKKSLAPPPLPVYARSSSGMTRRKPHEENDAPRILAGPQCGQVRPTATYPTNARNIKPNKVRTIVDDVLRTNPVLEIIASENFGIGSNHHRGKHNGNKDA